jgi:hypothetical protein
MVRGPYYPIARQMAEERCEGAQSAEWFAGGSGVLEGPDGEPINPNHKN